VASGLDAVAEGDTLTPRSWLPGTELITPLFQFDTPTGLSEEFEEALIRS